MIILPLLLGLGIGYLGFSPDGDDVATQTITQDPFIYFLLENAGWLLFTLVFTLFLWRISVWIKKNQEKSGIKGATAVEMFKPKLFDRDLHEKILFDDIVGQEEVKRPLKTISNFLKDPRRYTKLGAEIPRSVLLAGQSPEEQAALIKATAHEAQVPVFVITAAELLTHEWGSAYSRTSKLFQEARNKAPALIIVEEFDALGDQSFQPALNNVALANRAAVTYEFLTQLSGMNRSQGIILIATAQDYKNVPKVLRDAHYFEEIILPEALGLTDLYQLFQKFLGEAPVDAEAFEESSEVIIAAHGFTPSEVKLACNQAALRAAENARQSIAAEDLLFGVEHVKRLNTLNDLMDNAPSGEASEGDFPTLNLPPQDDE